ncbi:MAG: class I SAM-dependent methyltransferase [Spirochaetia bacterium]|jgi:SAM-dependent methyltransferase|nr:class I SAM-dependent methyltransferase [Spirochaetia bacterium]
MSQFDFDGQSFDGIAGVYDDVRPGYGTDVYAYIHTLKPYGRDSDILEIGSGTGIATREIADFWKARITALEPGDHLIAKAKERLRTYRNVELVKTRFEDFETTELFDSIFSATAFHWIDPGVKYEKAASLLKDNGLLAMYWNNFKLKDENMQDVVEEVYVRHGMQVYDEPVEEIQKENMQRRMDEIGCSGYFKLVAHQLFPHVFVYDAEAYIKLLRTFSDHSKGKVPQIEKLFQEIKELVLEAGSKVDVSVAVDLDVAQET